MRAVWTLSGIVTLVALIVACPRTNEARELERSQRALNDGVLRAVILGDSVAHGAGDERRAGIAGALDRQLALSSTPAAAVVNLGINGARTPNVRALLSQRSAQSAISSADVVVLSIGGKDLYGDSVSRLLSRIIPRWKQRRTTARVAQIVETVRRANPAAHIYVLGLYNPYRHSHLGRWLDGQVNLWDARLITRFASARDLTVVRICDLLDRDDRISSLDHFHPGWKGYDAIAARIAASM